MSTVSFTPILGCEDGDPLCYLLTVDECNILLDCGWDPSFTADLLKPLEEILPTLDAILISHPDIWHLGALPYLVGKVGLPPSCKVYATIPVCKLGQMFMYDAYQSYQLKWEQQLRLEVAERGLDPYSNRAELEGQLRLHGVDKSFDTFDLDDVDLAFADGAGSCMRTLRYSQLVALSGKGSGISITPIEAGHSVGGTIWKICKETEEIVYAVDFNHKTERHLNGAKLELIKRPTHFITNAYTADDASTSKEREKTLYAQVVNTLRNGGNVLMPTDTAARSLALLVALDQHWQENPGLQRQYTLVFLCEPGGTVVEKLGGLIEYLSDSCKKASNHKGSNLFDFKFVQMARSLDHLSYFKSPMVVLATQADLNAGLAKHVFSQWAEDSKNSVIFTTRGSRGTLQHQLLAACEKVPQRHKIDFIQKKLLDGAELEAFELARDAKVAAATAAAAEAMKMEVDEEGEVKLDSVAVEQLPTALQRENSEIGARWSWEQPANGFRSFMYKSSHLVWTEYGAEPDWDVFTEADKQFGTQPVRAVMEVSNGDLGDQADVQQAETPFTLQKVELELTVNARILYIDLEGRTDNRDLKKIIQNHEPRQLVLIRGSREASDALREACIRARPKMKVFTPNASETIELTSDLNMFKVLVDNNLFTATQWQQCGDYEVGHISGVLEQAGDSMNTQISAAWQIVPEAAQQLRTGSRALAVQDLEMELAEDFARPLFHVGRLQLSDFKLVLEKAGIRAEFRGGKLAVGDEGAVVLYQSKRSKGEITLDGAPSVLFFRVRDLLYDQYCVI